MGLCRMEKEIPQMQTFIVTITRDDGKHVSELLEAFTKQEAWQIATETYGSQVYAIHG
jgi:hypothetical protein